MAISIAAYFPAYFTWSKLLSPYAVLITNTSRKILKVCSNHNVVYEISLDSSNFMITAYLLPQNHSVTKEIPVIGSKAIDEVTYNGSLWLALLLASLLFIPSSVWLRFFGFSLIILFLWHVLDIVIVAHYTGYKAIVFAEKLLNPKDLPSNNLLWSEIWEQSLFFKTRILDPFLPLLLWIVFCSRTFIRGLDKLSVIKEN